MSGTLKVGGKTLATHDTNTNVSTLTADAAVIEGSSSGNLVRITQTGTGNALVIEDSTNPDSTPFVVDASGSVFVGGTIFNANDSISFTKPSLQGCTMVAATTGTTNMWRWYNGNGNVGTISISGTSTTYDTASDCRLKENITEITDGITRVKQLNPSRFNFIADPDRIVDGFIAHEIQGIVPEAVSGEKDAVDSDGKPEYQGVDYGRITPLLTAALKEAIEKIEMLEARIAVLEAK